MEDTDIARIRAYAVQPPGMPAAGYAGVESAITPTLEILRLNLVDGSEGVAAFDSGWDGRPGGHVVRAISDISPQYLGQCATHPARLMDHMLKDAGDGPWPAMSLLDCAMWDALARHQGQPLWQMLGARVERIQAYASIASLASIDDYLESVRHYAAQGYGAVKPHMSGDLAMDLELVQILAREFGEDGLRFMIDLEEAYDFDDALILGQAVEGLPFDWMEAPLPDTELDAYAELNSAVTIDVLPAGNTLVGMEAWNEGLRKGAWSRLRCDATYSGGISMVLRGMDLARELAIPVELQSFGFQPTQQANLHLMLGRGGCSWFERPAPAAPYDYATRNPLTLETDGVVSALDGPGLGLDVDWPLIETDAELSFDSLEES